MSILENLKTYLALFFNSQKNQDDDPEDYMERFERLHRNGMSDGNGRLRKESIPVYLPNQVLIMLVRLMRRVGFLKS